MSNILEGIMKDVTSVPEKLKGKVKGGDTKKLVFLNVPYILIGYFGDKVADLWRVAEGSSTTDKVMEVLNGMNTMFSNPLPSFHPKDLLIGVGCGVALRLIVSYKAKKAKKFRQGAEYGSARWGNAKDIEPYIDPVFEKNVLLTQTERLMMSGRPKEPKYARNKNILVIGGSGSGKTRFFVKPNLMQMHSSYVVTDPKGTVLVECGKMLKKGNYKIKVLNTINFSKSMHYNPFAYIRSEKDILKLVNTIIVNTKGEGQQSGEDFWVKAEKLYYTALIAYIWYEAPEEEQNFAMLIDMIDASEAREDDEEFKNGIDLLFEELEAKNPNHFAVRQYKKYKLAAGKTAKSILISCGARLAPFDIKELRDLMEYDELELDTLGEKKTALFVIISDTDATFNFVVSIMYSQLFNLLCDKADDVYNGRLPVHVRMLLDEFANIGQIPQFEKLIATIRSREISASIILQSKSQLKAIYKDNADTIEGNCDTLLFLGGQEKTTLKELAEVLGKETIDLYNTSDTRGTSQSYGLNYQKTGKELMSQDEIAVMDGGKCIMRLRGVRPFFSDKFDITKHKRYRELSDFDKKNAFDIENYVKRRNHMKVTPETEVDDVFECGEELFPLDTMSKTEITEI
jgi:type IV secretion system protein VirD4